MFRKTQKKHKENYLNNKWRNLGGGFKIKWGREEMGKETNVAFCYSKSKGILIK